MESPTSTIEMPIQPSKAEAVVITETKKPMGMSDKDLQELERWRSEYKLELESKLDCAWISLTNIDIEAGSANKVTPLAEFTLFPKLPKELQIKIWSYYRCPRVILMRQSGALLNKFFGPPATRVCRDARIEIMKNYTFIQSDEDGHIDNTGTWIDPGADTILLWDHAEQMVTSSKHAGGDIKSLELYDNDAECFMRCNPSFALGPVSRPNIMGGKWHVAIPQCIFAGNCCNEYCYDDYNCFEFHEKQHLQKFLQDEDYTTLTFVWRCDATRWLNNGDIELIEESDDHTWNRYLIEGARKFIEVKLSSIMGKVPDFKMARLQKRGAQETCPEWWPGILNKGHIYWTSRS